MNSAIRHISLFLLVSFVLGGCKSGRGTQDSDRNNLPNKRAAELVDSLKTNELNCDWMSIKYEVEVKTSKVDDSFKLYVRMKQDSVIWISATYYAVEIGRFLFTPDSVKYIDRRNNKYYVGGYDYITEKFMIHADYSSLQSLITGNGSAFISSPDEKIKTSKGDGVYLLSFLNKSQLRRAMRMEESRKAELVVSLALDPTTYRLKETMVMDMSDERRLTATYSDFMPQCNSSYPNTIVFLAESANEQASVKTSVMKMSTNKQVSVSFTIPEKYEALVP